MNEAVYHCLTKYKGNEQERIKKTLIYICCICLDLSVQLTTFCAFKFSRLSTAELYHIELSSLLQEVYAGFIAFTNILSELE